MQKALQGANSAPAVPPEVLKPQQHAQKLIARIRKSWPSKGDTYPADVSFLLIERAREVLQPLERRVNEFLSDDRSEADPDARARAEAFNGFLGRAADFLVVMEDKIQSAARPQIGPSAPASQVQLLVPEFREQLVNVLAYAVDSWAQLNRAHTSYPLWMDGTNAEDVAAALQSFLEEEWNLPGAKKPLHWGWKVGMGVVAAGAVGYGGYRLWQRYQGQRQLMEPEDHPTGIHVFEVEEGSGDVRVIDAEIVTEVEGVDIPGSTALQEISLFMDKVL